MKQKNIFHVKNTRPYKNLFLLLKDDYYNFRTGEKTTRVIATKGTIIQLSETNITNYIVKDKKVNIDYIYQSKEKKDYIMSSSLTTNFMKRVLFDNFNTNSIVVSSPHFLIVFLGFQNTRLLKLDNTTPEEIDIILGNIFQGIPFESLELVEFLKIVKGKTKKLPFILLGFMFIFVVFVYLELQEQEEELNRITSQNQKGIKPQKISISNPDLLAIIKTNTSIKQIYDIPLTSGSFVGEIEFTQQSATIFNFAPVNNSFLRDGYFKTPKRFSSERTYTEMPFLLKTPKECLKTIGEYKEFVDLSGLYDNKINFLLRNNEFSVDKLDSFLREIYRCPIIFKEGHVQFVNLNRRNVQINIQLVDVEKINIPNNLN